MERQLLNEAAQPWEQMFARSSSLSPERVVESMFPGLEIARPISLGEVWDTLQQAGFLYPEKEQKLKPFMPQIRETMSALLDREDLLKTFVLRQNGAAYGHVSAARAYQKTWMVQHLAACREARMRLATASVLTLAFIRYCALDPEMEWLKVYFRPDNKWPARVFGGYACRLTDPQVSDLRTYHYMVSATGTKDTPHADVEIRRADRSDYARIEAWYRYHGRTLEARADDLDQSSMPLDAVHAMYRSAGLERRREVLIAERGGRMAAFALLEISSRGINFSELTNTFKVNSFEPGDPAARVLISAARARYAQAGRTSCIALCPAGESADFEACGFSRVKQYSCWTFSRSAVPGFYDYLLQRFRAC